MFKKIHFFFIIIYFSCSSYQFQNNEIKDENISVSDEVNLKDKISQMFMLRIDGKFHNKESWGKKDIEYFIRNYKIGGLITFSGNIHGTYSNIKHYQNISKIPLFIASDYERGLGVFINGTLFPPNMALKFSRLEKIAEKFKTIPYIYLTGLTNRVERIYV